MKVIYVAVIGGLLVILKLVGVISWSWWWVTLPFLGIVVLFIVLALICLVGSSIIQ